MNKDLLLPFEDYCRIHNTIYSLMKFDNMETNHCCAVFSMLGAAILDSSYNIIAKPVAGSAFYRVAEGNNNRILTFDGQYQDKLGSTSTAFHVWLETDDWLIDFSSPIFPNLISCPSKMMQKQLSEMAIDQYELTAVGDFYLAKDPQLTPDLSEEIASNPHFADLLEAALCWYRPPHISTQNHLRFYDAHGKPGSIELIQNRIEGCW